MEIKDVTTTLASGYLYAVATQNPYEANDLGIDQDLAAMLGSLSMQEYAELVERAGAFINVEVDEASLSDVIEDIVSNRGTRHLEDFFILHHASTKMMNELFGMTSREFSNRRSVLGLYGKDQHRPRKLDEKTEEFIWKCWKNHEDIEYRERLLMVSEETGESLREIWSVIKRLELH